VATINTQLLHDVSVIASLNDTTKGWGYGISNALATFGWIQANDTGQAVWVATVLTLTQVTVGANAVYSYSSFTGPTPRVGMSVIFTGFGTGGNNVTATLTAVSGGASGTVTVVLSTQANETHAGSGTTTASVLPAASNYLYEIWGPGDGGTQFYLKISYGLNGSSQPSIKVNIGTTTNGAGTLSGTSGTEQTLQPGANSGVSLTYNCLFSGSTNYFGMMMWRDAPSSWNAFVAIDRSHTSAGADTSAYVNLFAGKCVSNGFVTQAIVFGVGMATILQNTNSGGVSQLTAIYPNYNTNGGTVSGLFNGTFAISSVFPNVGYFDWPTLMLSIGETVDFTEGSVISTTLLGATHNFVFSKNQVFAHTVNNCVKGIFLRWE
jgi:hypothetical protein